jgi:transposase-like protein
LFEKGCCSVFITTLRQHEIKRITVTIVSYRDLEEIMEERGLMLIMLRSIVGLSVIRQPLL